MRCCVLFRLRRPYFEAIFFRIRESLRLNDPTTFTLVSAILTVRERSKWVTPASLPTARLRRFLSTPIASAHSISGTSLEIQRLRLVGVRVKDRTVRAGSDRAETM